MDTDTSPARLPASTQGGTVEPANRATEAKERFQTPVDTAGEDSFSFLSALAGDTADAAAKRSSIVHHSINGSFVIRDGNWKLAFCPDSGGWSNPRPGSALAEGLPPVQLYDRANDPIEKRNISAEQPEIGPRHT